MNVHTTFDTLRGAVISDCGLYRYSLWRTIPGGWTLRPVLFIGLNPSTADDIEDDQTVRKLIGFAQRWQSLRGLASRRLLLVNLAAYRATRPSDMAAAADPIGPDNNAYIHAAMRRAKLIVPCWGRVPDCLAEQAERITHKLNCWRTPVLCLGKNQDGSPKHPARLAYTTNLVEF